MDDDENALKLVKANLGVEGYDVITASNGLEGIRLLDEREPALILLDIRMPGMDGFQTLKIIREQSKVPVIILTANDDMATLEKAMRLGADDFLTKPFNLRLLSARVRAKLKHPSPP